MDVGAQIFQAQGSVISQEAGMYGWERLPSNKYAPLLEALYNKAATKEYLQESVEQLHKEIKEDLKTGILQEHTTLLTKHAEHHKTHIETQEAFSKTMSHVEANLGELSQDLCKYAKQEEMKSIVTDIEQNCNSIKQLDNGKADKKDVDYLALETGNLQKLSGRLEGLEADFLSIPRQEIHQLQEKWFGMEGRLEECCRQFQHWEHMWEKLSGYVEDLVVKVGELQGPRPGTARQGVQARARSSVVQSNNYMMKRPSQTSQTMPGSQNGAPGGHAKLEALKQEVLADTSNTGGGTPTDQAATEPPPDSATPQREVLPGVENLGDIATDQTATPPQQNSATSKREVLPGMGSLGDTGATDHAVTPPRPNSASIDQAVRPQPSPQQSHRIRPLSASAQPRRPPVHQPHGSPADSDTMFIGAPARPQNTSPRKGQVNRFR